MKIKLVAIFLLTLLTSQLTAQNASEAGKFVQEIDSIMYKIDNESDVYHLKQSRAFKFIIRGACGSDNNIKTFKKSSLIKRALKSKR